MSDSDNTLSCQMFILSSRSFFWPIANYTKLVTKRNLKCAIVVTS